jgi:hypothetical protein
MGENPTTALLSEPATTVSDSSPATVAADLVHRTPIRYPGACPHRISSSTAPFTAAMRYAAERRNLDKAVEELRQIADGRNDILAEAAGITAGSWYASPATYVGYELIGAGMLIPSRPGSTDGL